MKRFISSFAIAASMFCGSVMAQNIPTKFNYQGVCAEKNSEITVKFTIKDATDDTVYFEEQKNVSTNANGMFTTQIGNKETDWNEVDWVKNDLVLETRINGTKVSTTAFTAVPYAKVAEKYVGQEYIEETVQSVATLPAQVTAMQTILNGYTNEETGEEVKGLIEKTQDAANIAENAYRGAEQAHIALFGDDENDGLLDQFAVVSSDLQEMQGLPVQVTAMQTILNGYTNEETGEEVKGLIEKTQDAANIAENAYRGAEQAHIALFGDDENDGLLDQFAVVSSDLQEMQGLPVQVTAMQTILNGYTNEETGEEVKGLIEKTQDAANIAENAYRGAEQAHIALFGDDENDGLLDQFAIVSSDVQEMQGLPVQVTAMQTILNGYTNEETGEEVKGLIEKTQDAANIAENAYRGAEQAHVVLFGEEDDDTTGLLYKVENLYAGADGESPIATLIEENLSQGNLISSLDDQLNGAEEGELSLAQKAEAAYENAMDANDKIYNEEYGIAAQLEQITYLLTEDDADGGLQQAFKLATENSKNIDALESALNGAEEGELSLAQKAQAAYENAMDANDKIYNEEYGIAAQLEQITYLLTEDDADGGLQQAFKLATENSKNIDALESALNGAEEGELSLAQKAEAAYENAMDANKVIYDEEEGILAQLEQVSYFISGEDSEFASVSSLATQNSKNIADLQAENEYLHKAVGALIDLIMSKPELYDEDALKEFMEAIKTEGGVDVGPVE